MRRPHFCRSLGTGFAALAAMTGLACDEELGSSNGVAVEEARAKQIFLEVRGTGEAGFSGRVEANLDDVFAGSTDPYVICRSEKKEVSVAIADLGKARPNIPLLVLAGVDGEGPGVTGDYRTFGSSGYAVKNGQPVQVDAYIDQKGIEYLVGKGAMSFFNAKQDCTISIQAQTGTYSCNFVEPGIVRETIAGSWKCHGRFNEPVKD
ncbi:MAG: hypothetical protein HYT87_06905 [Nitrospirae bacterium]|nr:hypothetical protein [Nitrospirota bacterium]